MYNACMCNKQSDSANLRLNRGSDCQRWLIRTSAIILTEVQIRVIIIHSVQIIAPLLYYGRCGFAVIAASLSLRLHWDPQRCY